MKVFVTGGAGFVGSQVVRRFLSGGSEIAVLVHDRYSTARLDDIRSRIRLINGDLRDLSSFLGELADFQPDTIVHLAWWGVLNKHRNDLAQLQNIKISTDLIVEAGKLGVRNWIGLGSHAEYGPHPVAISEVTPSNPTTLYGAAKLAAFHLSDCLCRQFGIRFVWMRLFSSYGPGDHESWLIPYLTLSLLRGERPALTAGEQLWDYIHVVDAADAIYSAACGNLKGVFNVGSGQTRTIREIVEMIRDLVKPGLPLGFGKTPYRPDQVMHLEADIARLSGATGWKPRIQLSEGLAETVKWYRERQGRRFDS